MTEFQITLTLVVFAVVILAIAFDAIGGGKGERDETVAFGANTRRLRPRAQTRLAALQRL